MIGLDATTLIAFELKEHPLHQFVRGGIRACVAHGDRFALADQTVWEFLHIVTDQRRFSTPLQMPDAIQRAQRWTASREVVHLDATSEAQEWTLKWMEEFNLGRKRILDTSLAALFHVNRISRIATANPLDFELFNLFTFEPWALAKGSVNGE